MKEPIKSNQHSILAFINYILMFFGVICIGYLLLLFCYSIPRFEECMSWCMAADGGNENLCAFQICD